MGKGGKSQYCIFIIHISRIIDILIVSIANYTSDEFATVVVGLASVFDKRLDPVRKHSAEFGQIISCAGVADLAVVTDDPC